MNDISKLDSLDLIWGADAIARVLNVDTRKAFYLLSTEKIPAKKIGRQWVVSRDVLLRFLGEAAQ